MTEEYETEITIGTTLGDMVYIQSLQGGEFPAPYVRFFDYVEAVTNLDGSRRALGPPKFTLDWGNLEVAQRDILQAAYCADALQSTVYMSVPTNNNGGEYRTFRCFFNWPNEGEVTRENGILQKLVVECTEAVDVTPS